MPFWLLEAVDNRMRQGLLMGPKVGIGIKLLTKYSPRIPHPFSEQKTTDSLGGNDGIDRG
jgi:hypothetical protein